MRKIERCDAEKYPVLVEIWERAVRATHDFLEEKDIQEIKAALIPEYFPQVEVFVLEDDRCGAVGFIGILGGKIEMLFVDSACHGQGFGTELIEFAINNGATAVDVNEQNPSAVRFYMMPAALSLSCIWIWGALPYDTGIKKLICLTTNQS